MSSPLILRLLPFVFVFLWSTGWIAARAVAPYAEPFTFLAVRYCFTIVALIAFAVLTGAQWPRSPTQIGHALVTGVLLHAIYMGAVWYAVLNGVPTSVSGIIAALQPILTAMLAPALLGERITPKQWLGVVIGFAGIGLVLQPQLAVVDSTRIGDLLWPLAINLFGMLGVTFGTFYQKRFQATGDLRSMAAIQYVGAGLALFPFAILLENGRLEWNVTTIAVMAWSVFGLSIGGIALLLYLLRTGEVSRAAVLIYLVPPVVALQAFAFFGETLAPIQIVGMALAAIGVVLATRKT
jgi:drug/metabolite transporter (DMT)-like permease